MSIVRTFVQNVFKRIGYDIHKIHPVPETTPINVLPLVIADLVERRKREGDEFFFIEIGAHDGLHGDPIRPFVLKYRWKGIMVEPQPRIFRRLVQNYSDESQLIFENAAIASENGQATLYAFSERSGLPDHATMLASFSREVLEHNAHGYVGEIEELAVPAITFESLVTKHAVRHVDLLQIDTEGYDFQIIRMLAKSPIKPEIIHFESAFMNREEAFECANLLHDWGYRVLTIGIDTIAYRQRNDDEFLERLKNEGYD